MSVFSIEPKPGNPVTPEVFQNVCSTLDVTVENAAEQEDLRVLLAVFHEAAEDLMALPDFEPPTNLARFPRENVHFPEKTDNEHGAWAWKVHITDKTIEKEGVLNGKTVAVKDNIAIAKVPMLMGTDFVKNYTPVRNCLHVRSIEC
jgi:amidase